MEDLNQKNKYLNSFPAVFIPQKYITKHFPTFKNIFALHAKHPWSRSVYVSKDSNHKLLVWRSFSNFPLYFVLNSSTRLVATLVRILDHIPELPVRDLATSLTSTWSPGRLISMLGISAARLNRLLAAVLTAGATRAPARAAVKMVITGITAAKDSPVPRMSCLTKRKKLISSEFYDSFSVYTCQPPVRGRGTGRRRRSRSIPGCTGPAAGSCCSTGSCPPGPGCCTH